MSPASRKVSWRRRAKRARWYFAAFSLQLYLTIMFSLFSVLRFVDGAGFAAEGLWPFLYLGTAAVLAAGILRPFSRQLAAAGGALIAVTGAARVVALVELAWRTEGGAGVTFGTAVAGSLWGLVVVVGLRWPRIAWESGTRHLIDVGSSECAPPEPAYPPVSGG